MEATTILPCRRCPRREVIRKLNDLYVKIHPEYVNLLHPGRLSLYWQDDSVGNVWFVYRRSTVVCYWSVARTKSMVYHYVVSIKHTWLQHPPRSISVKWMYPKSQMNTFREQKIPSRRVRMNSLREKHPNRPWSVTNERRIKSWSMMYYWPRSQPHRC